MRRSFTASNIRVVNVAGETEPALVLFASQAGPRRLRRKACHGRQFRVWRWEQAVAQCVDTEWTKVGAGSGGVALKD